MRIAIWCLFITVFIGLKQYGLAQTKSVRISGQIFSPARSPISNANIQLKLVSDGNTISFTRSDENGRFSIPIPEGTAIKSCSILITHIAFEEHSVSLKEEVFEYEISLKDKIAEIAEVKVGIRPQASLRGDTITYAMSSFAKAEDRSVADVLKRMPGFAISNDGKISYNGQQVSTLFIGGDDLMGNRYGLATRTVPHHLVLDVEVLRNHQPLKVLQDRVFSNAIAINLVIKDEAKLKTSGEASVGGGFPSVYDVKGNIMQFNDRIKFLHNLQSNNRGDRIDMEVFNDGLSNLTGGQQLSIGSIYKPALPQHRFYNNTSGLLSTNQLVNLKNDWKWKMSLDGFLDKELSSSQLNHYLIADADQLFFTERKRLKALPKMLQVEMNWMQNIPNRYIEFDTQIFYANFKALGRYENDADQKLLIQNWKFEQRFKYIPMMKNKDVITVEGQFWHGSKPSSLAVENKESSNDLIHPFLYQDLEIISSTADVFFKYHLKPKKIIQNYQIGLAYSNDQLFSQLDSMGGMPWDSNQLNWKKASIIARANYNYTINKLRFNLTIPLSQQYLSYTNTIYNSADQRSDLVFAPLFQIKFSPNYKHEWNTEYRYLPTFSNYLSVYDGLIMWNNRDFRRMNLGIQQQQLHTTSLNYRFNYLPTLSTAYLSYQYSFNNSNTTPKLSLANDAVIYESFPIANRRLQHQVNTRLVTYIKWLKSNASISYIWNWGKSNYLLGEELMINEHTTQHVGFNLGARLDNKLSILYGGTLSFSDQRSYPSSQEAIADVISKRMVGLVNQNHHFQLSYSWQQRHFINLQHHFLHSNRTSLSSNSFHFLDASFRSRFLGNKLDVEIAFRNLMNVKRYYMASFIEQWILYHEVALRGRQSLLQFSYIF